MLKTLWNDEAGVILSAEIVLVATILVLGMIVGLVELQTAVVSELNDVSDAIGDLNQSYETAGFFAYKKDGTTNKSRTYGATFNDAADDCDNSFAIVCNDLGEN